MKDLRRLVVVLVIGSFSIAALMGIAALLGAAEFGDTQGRILLTTVIVGVASTVTLALLTVAGHRLALLGVVGGVATLVATGAALTLTWGGVFTDDGDPDALLKVFGVAAIVAVTCAQLALLVSLLLRPGAAARHRGLLAGTAAVATLAAIMAIGPILNESDPGGDYWRVFGVVAILDVLGSVVLIALGAFGRVRDAAPPPTPRLTLTPDQQERVTALAAARDTTPAAILAAAIDSYLP